MDTTDPAAALIARNQRLLMQAAEARQRAREAAARAEQRVQQAKQALLAAERALHWVAPAFSMPGEPIRRLKGTPHNSELRQVGFRRLKSLT